MSRQRTKIGEPVFYVEERNVETGEQVAMRYEQSRAEALAERARWADLVRSKHGETACYVVRVTRYRLAPLVELPAWRPSTDADPWPQRYMIAENDKIHAWIEALGAWGIGDDLDWGNAEIFGEGQEVSVLRALEACEACLRELGYRVAKAKRGGAK